MKDELRRYVNKFPTAAIENLNEQGSPAFFGDYTVPKVGSRVGFSVRSNEGVWNHETGVVRSITPVTYQWESASGEVYTEGSYKYNVLRDDGAEHLLCAASVHIERERFLPNSRWMYFFEELINIFYLYGEEKLSKPIAKKIVEVRKNKRIETTQELVKVIESAVGAKYFNKSHPERQIFQAIRIEVNSELSVLQQVLPDAIDLLKKGGRISVITFHSLEDRIVKQIFKKESEINDLVKGLPSIPDEYKPKIKLINKKPILPSFKELEENSRSKSAKLRIIERV